MRRAVSCLLGVLLVSTACDGPASRSPTLGPAAPPLGPALAPPAASPNVIPIAVGQTVSGVVALSDPFCESDWDPCQRFAIAISTSGVLKVRVSSPGPSTLTLRVGSQRVFGETTVSGATGVQAGSTYEISVALHDAVGRHTSEMFELTTSLEPL